jgi:GNAT superfamily N-acetyltransferase
MELVELAPGDPRFEADALPVLRELRPHLTASSSAAVYEEGFRQGLRYSAVYLDGRCVGVAGWRIVAAMVAIRKLYVDDLVTTESCRGRGVGRFLLGALVERAKESGCVVLDLDSGLERHDAHRFYEREGFERTSFHFARLID